MLQIQQEMMDKHKDTVDTVAGEAVNKKIDEQIRQNQAESKAVLEDMLRALEEKAIPRKKWKPR